MVALGLIIQLVIAQPLLPSQMWIEVGLLLSLLRIV